MIIPLIYIYSGLAIALLILTIPLIMDSPPVIKLKIRFWGSPAQLKKAIKKATLKHQKDGKRYRVYFIAMRYRVYHRSDVKDLKKRGIFNWFINVTNTEAITYFDTNSLKPEQCSSQPTK